MRVVVLTLLVAGLAGCSSSGSPSTTSPPGTSAPRISSAATTVHSASLGAPVAIVTAETEHAVLEVSATTGHVLKRVHVDGDPTTLAAGPAGPIVVCSPAAGVVTLLSWPGLRPTAVLHGFHSPQIAAVTPDGEFALVSDSAGTVSTVNLTTDRVADRVEVGSGAHHMAVSPNQRTAWVALGENATTIVRLDTSDPTHLRVIGLIHPRLAAHDLAFAPDGKTVWVSSATAPVVSVFSSVGHPLATVPAGTAPQHVAFSRTTPTRAYIASGYGRSLEVVDPATRRVVRRTALPYGSFNLATLGPLVATTSLLDGKVTIDSAATLRRRLSATVAPAAREIVLLRRFAPAIHSPVPDYVGRYRSSGRLSDGGQVALSSNGNVHMAARSSRTLLVVGRWGAVRVACRNPVTSARFVLTRYARGESAQVQSVAASPSSPFALVPLGRLGTPITLPRSGPPQQVTLMQLSVATEAFSVSGTILVSVQVMPHTCEASAVASSITH